MLPPISFHFEVDFWASQSSRTNAHMNRSEWPKTSRHDRPVRSRIIWHVVLWKTLRDLFKKPKVSDWDWRLHWNLLWHWTYFYLGGLSQIEKILSHSGRVFRDVVSAHEVRMQVIRNFLLLEVQVRELWTSGAEYKELISWFQNKTLDTSTFFEDCWTSFSPMRSLRCCRAPSGSFKIVN